jgi:hypothetical protein
MPTTIYSQTAGAVNSSGWQGFNFRQIIPANTMSAPPGGSNQVIFSFQTGSGTNLGQLDSAYIGTGATSGDLYAFTGNQVQLSFGGLTSIPLTGGIQTYTSDPVTFTIDVTQPFVFAAHFSGVRVDLTVAATAGFDEWWIGGADQSATTDPAGYSHTGSSVLNETIQVQTSTPPPSTKKVGWPSGRRITVERLREILKEQGSPWAKELADTVEATPLPKTPKLRKITEQVFEEIPKRIADPVDWHSINLSLQAAQAASRATLAIKHAEAALSALRAKRNAEEAEVRARQAAEDDDAEAMVHIMSLWIN